MSEETFHRWRVAGVVDPLPEYSVTVFIAMTTYGQHRGADGLADFDQGNVTGATERDGVLHLRSSSGDHSAIGHPGSPHHSLMSYSTRHIAGFKLFRRHPLVYQEALNFLAAEQMQEIRLFLGLDPFSHNL